MIFFHTLGVCDGIMIVQPTYQQANIPADWHEMSHIYPLYFGKRNTFLYVFWSGSQQANSVEPRFCKFPFFV